MNSGTIGLLEDPAGETVGSWTRDGDLPALDVDETQDRLDADPVQTGMAASRVTENRKQIDLTPSGEVAVYSEEAPVRVATEWVAELTGAGVVIAESVTETGDGTMPFPFDLFTARTRRETRRVTVDTAALASAWEDIDDRLRDTWMTAEGDEEETIMRYGNAAHPGDAADADTGVGFEVAWEGTVVKGVVYESGYLAVWRDLRASAFVDFVVDEILPFAEVDDGEDADGEQVTLGGGSGD